jgi:metal-sulfur cluster biosynthetic enzyme
MSTEVQTSLAERVRDALRVVKYPRYSRDIVSFGLVRNVAVDDRVVRVELAVTSAKPETAFQIQHEAEQILKALPALKDFEVQVEIMNAPEPHAHSSNGEGAPLSPLQDELPHEGAAFDPDPLIAAVGRPDLAPGAGYGQDGPDPLGGPTGDRTSMRWHGAVPVFQWEIDPSDASREYGESEVERDGWVFRMWWQMHPTGLVYASVSAIAEEQEERPGAREHPIGRNVAVNLVYDLRREGVVAIYGTALDFRPFVEVFLEGFGIAKTEQSAESLSAQAQV